jgi:hypothetical protein
MLFLAMIVSATSVGCLRFLLAARFTRRVSLESVLLDDVRLTDVVRFLSREMGVTCHVTVRQTSEMSSAAVTSWFQPTILLPDGWVDWSESELESVLAHELAHILHGDFRRRCGGARRWTNRISSRPVKHCFDGGLQGSVFFSNWIASSFFWVFDQEDQNAKDTTRPIMW